MVVVVISSSGEGDRAVESLEVKAPVDRDQPGPIRTGGRATRQAAADANQEAPKYGPRVKRIAGHFGSAELLRTWRRPESGTSYWTQGVLELPGVLEGGMPGRNAQRKPGTTRGSPRRSRTAKAARISRYPVKSCSAREWGGWGQ